LPRVAETHARARACPVAKAPGQAAATAGCGRDGGRAACHADVAGARRRCSWAASRGRWAAAARRCRRGRRASCWRPPPPRTRPPARRSRPWRAAAPGTRTAWRCRRGARSACARRGREPAAACVCGARAHRPARRTVARGRRCPWRPRAAGLDAAGDACASQLARSREPCAWVGNGRCVCITRRPAESLACACGACAGPACRLCSYPAEPLKLQLKPESFQALLHATGRQGQICGCAVTSVAQRPFVCESATRLSATCLPSSLACRCARFSMHMPCTFPALRAACSLRTVGCLSFGGGRGCGARALHCRRGARLLSPRFVTCGTQRVLERAACLQLLPRRAGLRMQI